MTNPVLATTVVGSLPQPDWLLDRAALRDRLPARVRTPDLWRVAPEQLEQAQDDATVLAIRELERAGIDVITDGEIRRESYSNRFATALDGMDLDNPAEIMSRAGQPNLVPRVVGPIRRREPVEVRDLRFLREHTDRPVKITLPGPFTMSRQAVDEHYGDPRALALDLADAVNEEIRDLFAAGADVVQVDEPWVQSRPEEAREYAMEVIDRALRGVTGTTALHTCFGYAHMVHDRPDGYPILAELDGLTVDQLVIEAAQPHLDLSVLEQLPSKVIVLGVLDLGDLAVESVDTVADRIRAALRHVPAERLQLAPDCGMKYLPRDVAVGKLTAWRAVPRAPSRPPWPGGGRTPRSASRCSGSRWPRGSPRRGRRARGRARVRSPARAARPARRWSGPRSAGTPRRRARGGARGPHDRSRRR
jgi:5-methyltetrahydropteroyltriglutamate--homocysteine methyltransferase